MSEQEELDVLRRWKSAKVRHDQLEAEKEELREVIAAIADALLDRKDLDMQADIAVATYRSGMRGKVAWSQIDQFSGGRVRQLLQELRKSREELAVLRAERARLNLD